MTDRTCARCRKAPLRSELEINEGCCEPCIAMDDEQRELYQLISLGYTGADSGGHHFVISATARLDDRPHILIRVPFRESIEWAVPALRAAADEIEANGLRRSSGA